MAELSRWDNSLNQSVTEEARRLIREANGGASPRVLDCFGGGGAIPLEALRLGCETEVAEYNPVAVLVLKAALEYPQKFGRQRTESGGRLSPTYANPLLDDLKKWSSWLLDETRKEIGDFYPCDPDSSVPVGYIWARTIRCRNPSCGAEIPLMRQFWLSKKEGNKIALKLIAHKKTKTIEFEIVRGKHTESFDPSVGTTTRATALCPICRSGLDADSVRNEAKRGKLGQRLIAAVLLNAKAQGKNYRITKPEDMNVFERAENRLNDKVRAWKLDFAPIPDEPTPSGEGPGAERAFSIQNYGLMKWGDLFNSRQKLAMISFVEKVRQAHEKMLNDGLPEEYAKALTTYLALAVDMIAVSCNTLCRWESTRQLIADVYARQTISMIWDYVESNPFSGSSGSWEKVNYYFQHFLAHASSIAQPAIVVHQSATSLRYPENYFDSVMTDPPYYDNVPYSDLSDFFYVWLKRMVGGLYPDLFATPLSPKTEEIIVHTLRHGKSMAIAKKFFEDMITRSFKEIRRVLKAEGIAVIVFQYRSTEAWETIVSSLLNSGLTLTASWPIHTEMEARLRARESAALASSIYMVCRKRGEEQVAYFNEVREQIDGRIKERLDEFWEQGIRGADFFVSAIGPAVEVFGRYSKVEKLSGQEVSVKELLEYVRRVVAEYALARILKKPDLSGVDQATRFYLLWRWTFNNAKVPFDDARKIAQSVGGVELTEMWGKSGLVRKDKEFIKVLGPKDRVFSGKEKPSTMIDILHYVVVLWEEGDRRKLQETLDETGFSRSETFWQVAQAISDVLPEGDKERQLIQGFIYGRESYEKQSVASTLLDYVNKE